MVLSSQACNRPHHRDRPRVHSERGRYFPMRMADPLRRPHRPNPQDPGSSTDMPSRIKYAILEALRRSGSFHLVAGSGWRRRRLPILCYHGFALRDEHRWNPLLYITRERFEERLVALQRGGYTVLPLGEAIERLRAGALPPKAVAITVDDGLFDFAAVAYPILERFGMHATVYSSTYYVVHQRPVFNVMVSYLPWRGVENRVGTVRIGNSSLTLPLASRPEALAAKQRILRQADAEQWTGDDKHAFLGELASAVGEDWGELQASRLLSLMTPAELRGLDPGIVDVQLHTHRHRVPRDPGLFTREILDNRSALAAAGLDPTQRVHFCYPSGVHHPEFLPWLREAGVVSATTCEAGIASSRDEPLLLPRLIDTMFTPEVEFEAWISGVRGLLNRRTFGL
jgi:peptidoglycan/xylan/chitin deacetylase (PgdA/CDA1 family)